MSYEGATFSHCLVPKIAKTTCSRVVHAFFISLITRDRLEIGGFVQQTFFVGNNFPHLHASTCPTEDLINT